MNLFKFELTNMHKKNHLYETKCVEFTKKFRKKSTFGNQDILLSIGMKICTNKKRNLLGFFLILHFYFVNSF